MLLGRKRGGRGDRAGAGDRVEREVQERENVRRARSERELREAMRESGDRVVIVEFGAEWCEHCRLATPAFLDRAAEYKGAVFVLADVDGLPSSAMAIRYTPTFAFFKGGRKVDEVAGINTQQLADHCWLHCSSA